MRTVPEDVDFLAFVGAQESQFIRPASDWYDAVRDRLLLGVSQHGDALPWSETQARLRLRPGETTIWAGVNGHGKSLVLGQTMLWLLPATSVLIASLEMPPAATLARMLRQASGGEVPSLAFIQRWLAWTDERLWIYDQTDTVAPERILGMVCYAARELRIRHVVIDSLVKCGMAPDDYPAQKTFVDRLCWAAKTHGIHLHLVHHIRKREREEHVPDKYDIKGAGEITDLADNVLIVHRNKAKERRCEAGEASDPQEPDAQLLVVKQRHGEWEGRVRLYFDRPSQQLVPQPGRGAMPWPSVAEAPKWQAMRGDV
jgi:twinkle protein